jgi:uncharacterized membrane protein YhaH (DUF805 family)
MEQHPGRPQKRSFEDGQTKSPGCPAGASRNVDAGWSSPVARQAHNLKVVGSNPTPATKHTNGPPRAGRLYVRLWRAPEFEPLQGGRKEASPRGATKNTNLLLPQPKQKSPPAHSAGFFVAFNSIGVVLKNQSDLTRIDDICWGGGVLEKFAFILINEYVSYLTVGSYVLVLVPGILTVLLDNRTSRLQRAEYFSLTCAAIFAACLIGMSSIWTMDAMMGGYVWVIVVLNAFSAAAFGVFLGMIACARARDGFGSKFWGLLGFVPLANLWLLFKRSRQEDPSDVSTDPFWGGGSGVILGIVLSVAGGIVSVFTDRLVSANLDAAQKGPDFGSQYMALILRHYGLQGTLNQLAQDDGFPVVIDEFTNLTGMVADGTVLRRNFLVTENGTAVLLPTEAESGAFACEDAGLSQILAAGGTVRDIYVADNGRQLADYSITLASCSK